MLFCQLIGAVCLSSLQSWPKCNMVMGEGRVDAARHKNLRSSHASLKTQFKDGYCDTADEAAAWDVCIPYRSVGLSLSCSSSALTLCWRVSAAAQDGLVLGSLAPKMEFLAADVSLAQPQLSWSFEEWTRTQQIFLSLCQSVFQIYKWIFQKDSINICSQSLLHLNMACCLLTCYGLNLWSAKLFCKRQNVDTLGFAGACSLLSSAVAAQKPPKAIYKRMGLDVCQ